MRAIGSRVPQLRWKSITSGAERYAGDVQLEGTLVAGALRSPHPYATIVSIDTAAAERVPGVVAVVTAADLPSGALYIHHGGPLADRPPLAREVVRFIGQEVAAVAAEDEGALRRGLAAVRVRYRPSPAPTTLDQARAARRGIHARPTGDPVVSLHPEHHWGDGDLASRLEAVSVRGEFSYPRIAHVCMEPNTTLARWDPDAMRLELWTSTQAPYFVVKEVAACLGLDERQVVCREVAVGGGFGAKSKICEHEVIAGALARKAGRPVRLALSREEEFATTKTRHRFEVGLRISADEQGRLCGVEADVDVENGAYNHSGPSVLAAGVRVLGDLYEPVAARVNGRLIDTAVQPGGQFRGYGHPQITFALESLVDELAEKLAVDPVAFRLQNANRPETTSIAGTVVHTALLRECIETAAAEIGWTEKRGRLPRGRGVGLAVASGGSGAYVYHGANRSEGRVEVTDDGGVLVRFGGADAGTGQRTMLAQVAAEELGVDPEQVGVEMMDSERTPFDMGAWSSRGTQMSGQAVAAAARELASTLRALAADKLGQPVTLAGGEAVTESGERIGLGELVRLSSDAVDGSLGVTADYVMPGVEMPGPGKDVVNVSPSQVFTAHAVEVEVDEETGAVRILDYVAVHDSGTVLNPIFAEGQVVGAVVMGLGAALGEEVLHEHGRMVNPALVNYALPRAPDAPRVRAVFLQQPELAGPYGAKSIGEIPVVPPAPAVANAIYDAVGVRVRDLPITPDKVLDALAAQRGRRVVVASLWTRPSRWFIAAMRWAYPRGLLEVLHRYGTRMARPRRFGQLATSAPEDIDELAKIRPAAELVAGGTDVLPRAQRGLAKQARLVSLHRVRGLRSIEEEDDGSLRIGAMVTLAEAARRMASTVPVLAETIDTIASPQIRNMATIGGNLLQEKRCWFYRNGFDCYKRGGWTCPCYAVAGDHRFHHAVLGGHRCQAVTPSDLATTLQALDARATVRKAGGDVLDVALADLYTGPGETIVGPGDLLTEVRLGEGGRQRRGRFKKLNLWHGDFAMVSAAVTIPAKGASGGARVVLGGLGPTPWRSRAAEAELDAMADPVRALALELGRVAHPLEHNAWKLDAATGLVRRLVEDLRLGSDGPLDSVRT